MIDYDAYQRHQYGPEPDGTEFDGVPDEPMTPEQEEEATPDE